MAIGTPKIGPIAKYSASGTSSTVSYPSGVQAGDLLIIAIAARTSSSFSASGWTHLAAQSGSYTRFTFLYRVATAAHTGSVSVSGPAVLRSLKMLAIPGVDPDNPLAAYSDYSGVDGSVNTATMAGLTPPVPGCMPVWGATGFLGAGATYQPTHNNGQLNPPNTTEWLDTWEEAPSPTNTGRAGAAYYQAPLADTTPTTTRGTQASVSATSAGLYLLLRPAPSGPEEHTSTGTASAVARARAGTVSGALSDRTFRVYTAPNGMQSRYHIYAEGLDWSKKVGVLFYTDGSGDWGLENPDSPYLLAGPVGLIATAKKHNLVLVTLFAPGNGCTDGDGVCWYLPSYDGTPIADKIQWSRDLVDRIQSAYPLDRDRVVIGGYSSGAQWTTEYFGPAHGAQIMDAGVAIGISYGGQPLVTPNHPQSYKDNVPFVWNVGDQDYAYQSAGQYGVQAGYDWYTANGFTTEMQLVQGEDHDRYDYNTMVGDFGTIVDSILEERLLPAAPPEDYDSSGTAVAEASATADTSGSRNSTGVATAEATAHGRTYSGSGVGLGLGPLGSMPLGGGVLSEADSTGTATAQASASSDTSSSRNSLGTATSAAAASSTTEAQRSSTGTARLETGASSVTSSERSLEASAWLDAGAAGTADTQRSLDGVAFAEAFAGSATAAEQDSVGTAVAHAGAVCDRTTVRTVDGTATALASASGGVRGQVYTSGEALALASATAETAGDRASEGAAPAEATAAGDQSSTRLADQTAALEAGASGAQSSVRHSSGEAEAVARARGNTGATEWADSTGHGIALVSAGAATETERTLAESATAEASTATHTSSERSTAHEGTAVSSASSQQTTERRTVGQATAEASASYRLAAADESWGEAVATATASSVTDTERAGSGEAAAEVSAETTASSSRQTTGEARSYATAASSTTAREIRFSAGTASAVSSASSQQTTDRRVTKVALGRATATSIGSTIRSSVGIALTYAGGDSLGSTHRVGTAAPAMAYATAKAVAWSPDSYRDISLRLVGGPYVGSKIASGGIRIERRLKVVSGPKLGDDYYGDS